MTEDLGSGKGGRQRSVATPERLAGLVAARICHDIGNPLGAVRNELELLLETPAPTRNDITPVETGAARAAGMLQFARMAFGIADDSGTPLSGRELGLRFAVLGSARVSVTVGVAVEAEVRPTLARLAALMMLVARALLGLEGLIRLSLTAGDLPMTAEAFGERADWSAARQRLADGDDAEATPRDVEFLLLAPVARAAGARLTRIAEPGRAGLAAHRL